MTAANTVWILGGLFLLFFLIRTLLRVVSKALVRAGDWKATLGEMHDASHRIEAILRHPLRPTLKLVTVESDWSHSSRTGLGRRGWYSIGSWMLDNVLQYSDGLTQPIQVPPSQAVVLPRVRPNGQPRCKDTSRLEAFARPFLLAAFLLQVDPDHRSGGRLVSEYFLDRLMEGVSKNHEEYWGGASSSEPDQRLAEAASIVTALHFSRNELWSQLSKREQERVVRWIELASRSPVVHNNWHWFGLMVHGFLEQEGGNWSRKQVEGHISAIRDFHAGGGWFRDGNRFDFYCGWAWQYYPLIWGEWDTFDPGGVRKEIPEWNDAFLQDYAHLFARSGEMPNWGRSISYRFAASAPFAIAFRRKNRPSISAGFARSICSGNLSQFCRSSVFLKNGLLPLGFHGEAQELTDGYSSTLSPYWAAKAFACLTLKPENPFWSEPEEEGFWASPPKRYILADTGMWVEHDAESGHTRLFAPGNGPVGDPRYTGPTFDTQDAVAPRGVGGLVW